MKKCVIALALALLSVSADAAEMISHVRLLTPLDVPKTREARAMFEGLKPEALQFGLGEAALIGAVEYQPLSPPGTRVIIKWHSVGIDNISGATAKPLQSPLMSQFSVDAARIEANTSMAVRGDLDSVASTFLELKQQMDKNTPRDLVTSKTVEKMSPATSNDLAPSGSGQGANQRLTGSGATNSDQNTPKTDLIVSSYEDCSPRIDRAGGYVYPQARQLKTGQQSGQLMSTGACEDYGTAVAIQTVYGGSCADVVDVNQQKTFQQYSQFAVLDGKQIDIALCTADFATFYPIVGEVGVCGYRHDFTNSISVKQEELQYTNSAGEIKKVRNCGDSTTAYQHFTTQNTCTPTIDAPNQAVIANARVAFRDGNGAEQYATTCTPDPAQTFPFQEAFCSPKYEHDFTNHVSYYVTSSYYIDASGATHALSSCSRSPTASFPHVFQTTGCTVTNDDANKMTHWNRQTQIVTPVDGTLNIAPCQEDSSPTPYAYTGETRVMIDDNVYVAYPTHVGSNNSPSIKTLYPSANYTSTLNNYNAAFPSNSSWANETGGWNIIVVVFGSGVDKYARLTYLGTPPSYLGYHKSYARYDANYLRGDGTTYTIPGIHNDLTLAP